MPTDNEQGGLKSAAVPRNLRKDHEKDQGKRGDDLDESLADDLVDPLKDPLLADLPDGEGPGAGDPDPDDAAGGGPVQMDNGGGGAAPFDGWGPAAFGAVQRLGGPVQRSGDGSGDIQRLAADGIKSSSGALPHLDTIQQSFGGHDVSGVQAHTGGSAKSAAQAMGASAYATGNNVAFSKSSPSLHTAAHEAAHVVQQRAGVNVPGGVGQTGDRYERHADSVADSVVQGQSAEPLLNQMTGPAPTAKDAAAVQRKPVQMGWLGDAIEWGAGVIKRGVEAVFRWIDLMAAKGRVLAKICDTSWVSKAASTVKSNPHPKHKNRLSLSILGITLLCRLEAMSHALRIAGCDSLKQVDGLSKSVDKWQLKRSKSLKKQIEDKIDEYRKEEAKWLGTYKGTAPMEQKDVFPNKGSNKADIRLAPADSKVTLTSRLKIGWKHTPKAIKAGLDKKKPWKPKEKTGMLAKVQKQLDAVWGPGNQMKPFKIVQPEDYLLEKSAQKWSAILNTFHPKIVEDAKGGSTEINIWREAAGESKRANSANLYEQDVKAKYKKNKDGTFAPAAMEGLSNQHTQAHEFGHFGMGLPDEYNETGQNTGHKPWEKDFKKVIKDYDKKIAKLKKEIKKHPVKTADEKTCKAGLETKLMWWKKDRKALLSPWTRSYGKGKWKDKQPDMYILAPQNRPKDAPAGPPNEAFARWGGDGDVYAPGKRSARGQRENAFHTKDTVRVMNSGNRVEPYAYEPVLELVNALVVGKFDPAVKFEHNVKKGTKDWKVVQDVRKWNLKVDMGKAKAKAAAPGKAKKEEAPAH